MNFVLLILAAAVVSPLIVSFIAGGWVSKYMSPPFSFDDIPNLSGKVAIVTGTNTGIGYVTARELARKGATVFATARSKAKGEEAVDRMRAELGPDATGSITLMELDLASLNSVKSFAYSFTEKGLPLDLLILNAGVMMAPFSKTEDGFEMQIGTNHLGHFFLVRQLLPVLQTLSEGHSEPARVVHVSSMAHEMSHSAGIRLDTFDSDVDYNEVTAYGQSKLANVLTSNAMDRKFRQPAAGKRAISSNALHPGTIISDLARHLEPFFDKFGLKHVGPLFFNLLQQTAFMSTEDGALTQLFVATSAKVEGVSGQYFVPVGVQSKPVAHALNQTLQDLLWDHSLLLTDRFL